MPKWIRRTVVAVLNTVFPGVPEQPSPVAKRWQPFVEVTGVSYRLPEHLER
jgi:hypothetical protein